MSRVLRQIIVGLWALSSLMLSNYSHASELDEQQLVSRYKSEIKTADIELNKQYKKTYSGLGNYSKADLRNLQRLWLRNRNSKCKLKANLKHGEKWINSIKTKKKALCVKFETISRTKAIADFEKLDGIIGGSKNVCAALKNAVQAKADKRWLRARNAYVKFDSSTISPGEFVDYKGRQFTIDYTGASSYGAGRNVDRRLFDFEGDGIDELLMTEQETRHTQHINYFRRAKNSSRYVKLHGISNYGSAPGALHYHEKTYLVKHTGLYISPTGYVISHYSSSKKNISDYCSLSIRLGEPKYTSRCSNESVCKKVTSNPDLLTSISEHWDLAPTKAQDIDFKNLLLDRSHETREKTWVDIDNDGVNELALVTYGGPSYFKPFPDLLELKIVGW